MILKSPSGVGISKQSVVLGELVSHNLSPLLAFLPLVACRSLWRCNKKCYSIKSVNTLHDVPLMYYRCIKHLLQHLVTYIFFALFPTNGYDFTVIVAIAHLKVNHGGDNIQGCYHWYPQYAIVNRIEQDYHEQEVNTTFVVTLTKREFEFDISIRMGYSSFEALEESVVIRHQVFFLHSQFLKGFILHDVAWAPFVD